jgi:hypothetical protein
MAGLIAGCGRAKEAGSLEAGVVAEQFGPVDQGERPSRVAMSMLPGPVLGPDPWRWHSTFGPNVLNWTEPLHWANAKVDCSVHMDDDLFQMPGQLAGGVLAMGLEETRHGKADCLAEWMARRLRRP